MRRWDALYLSMKRLCLEKHSFQFCREVDRLAADQGYALSMFAKVPIAMMVLTSSKKMIATVFRQVNSIIGMLCSFR